MSVALHVDLIQISRTCRLVGDVLLATGFLSYSGPFNQEFRDLMLNTWKKEMRKTKIPFSEVFCFAFCTLHLDAFTFETLKETSWCLAFLYTF